MISISVYKQSNYPVSPKKIKDSVKTIFVENGIVSDAEVSVAIVSDKEIEKLANKYLGEYGAEAKDHPVLSFPTGEITKPFVFPDSTLHLGEIVISFHWVIRESKKTGKLVDEIACELAVHGALHLVGIHHD